jgi:CAAD domains of cyanobacterial aminoacyl-tRNA synthetase
MDNILVEVERIDHLAEIEAVATQFENPIAEPVTPKLDRLPTSAEPAETASDLQVTPTAVMPDLPAIESSDSAEKMVDVTIELPSYLAQTYQHNREAFITVGLFFGGLIALKLMLAIVAAVNTIPLFEPLFQTIGLGYTGWFVYRYLLKASARQELATEINTVKSKVIGR